ncbi:MAG: hypothetical protein Q7R45_17665 [Sulfuricaulis sp.]|nr:hypothetical protein [Sulfuricaulis sp.]
MQKVIDHLKAERAGAGIKIQMCDLAIERAKEAIANAEKEKAQWLDTEVQYKAALEKLG